MKKLLKYYAFFDVDNTIVKIKTMRSFLSYFYQEQYPLLGALLYKKYELGGSFYNLLGRNREFLNRRYYKHYQGYCAADLRKLSESWFYELENTVKELYIDSTLNEIAKHKNNGGEVVLVSGSFAECLFPIAAQLKIQHVLSTKLEVKNGIYTGNILSPQTIGQGKVQAIKYFLSKQKQESINLNHCYAYGDHISDLPMLNYVGKPHVIKGNAELESYAIEQGWPVLSNS